MLTIDLKKQIDLLLLTLMVLAFYVGNAAVEIVGAVCILRSFFVRHDTADSWNSPTFRVVIVIISIIMISSILNASLASVASSIALLRVPFLAAALVILMRSLQPNQMSVLFRFMAALLFVMCINSLWQAHNGIDVFGAEAQMLNGEVWRLTTPTGKLRIGYIITFVAVLTYGYLLSQFSKLARAEILFFIAASALSVATVFISGERVAAYLLITVIMVTSFLKLPKRLSFSVVLALLACVAMLLFLKPKTFQRHIEINFTELSNLTASSSHFKVFANAFHISSLRDVIGHGARTFQVNCQGSEDVPYPQYCTTHVHNLYLEVLFEGGIIAFLFLLMVVCSFIWKFFGRINSNTDGMVLVAGLVLLFKLIPIIPMPSIHAAWAFAPICLIIASFAAFEKFNS